MFDHAVLPPMFTAAAQGLACAATSSAHPKKSTTGHGADLSSDGDVEGKRARQAQARRRDREIIREVRCLNSRHPPERS